MSSSSKRIGLVTWDYARSKGGMGVSLQWIVGELRAMGHGPWVCSPSPDQGSPFLSPTRTFGGQILFSLLLPFALGRWVRRHGIDRLMLPVGPGGVFLIRKPHIPVTSIVYHTYLQQSRAVPGQRWKRIFLPFERRTLRTATRVLCFCADTQRVLTKEYGLTNATVLPHAVDIRAAAPDKDDAHIVCVARLEARKGVDVLLAAWPRIRQRVPHARLTIVGKGSGARKTDRMIARLPGVSRVHGLSRPALDALIAHAAVALCPAYLEGFGLAAAEAMAAGTVVVASDVDGLHSLIAHNRTGLLVPPGDSAALAHAVVHVLTDDALRTRLGRAAREEIRMLHDPAACARAIVDAVTALA